MNIRTYHDPLHHGITLNKSEAEESLIMKLIDSAAFQRLRRIRQLGPAFLTFHGAESSRFTHSLGAFHIARKAFNKLFSLDQNLARKKGLIFSAALLHDLGHSPLSHTGEEIFNLSHEEWSAKIIKEDPYIRDSLEQFQEGIIDEITKILEHTNELKCIESSLISSQLDCDRLDYLLRDSYSTGTNYGKLDLERILNALTIAPDGDLAINPKGLLAVEHYLVVRNLMYRSVYNHRINEVCNWILEKIIKTARELGPKNIWCDEVMAIWLWQPQDLDIHIFLSNDDIRTGYHLIKWKEEGPNLLSDLCKRFLNRDLLKALDIKDLTNEQKLEVLAQARKLSKTHKLNPDYSCGIRNHQQYGYQPYNGGLRLWDGKNLRALEEYSPLVKSLIKPTGSSWLIYPREIDQGIKEYLHSMREFSKQ